MSAMKQYRKIDMELRDNRKELIEKENWVVEKN